MCGIVGAVAQGDVVSVLVDGLRRLEYRGYDSAGLAVIQEDHSFARTRAVGRVQELEQALAVDGSLHGRTGIAHTRWATHGKPSLSNAHPHICRQRVAVVCNGIVENFERLRERQLSAGYEFTSETDTEVVVHQIYGYLEQGLDLLQAVQAAVADIEGAYAIGVISTDEPNRMVGARRGSPLVAGLGFGELRHQRDRGCRS